MREVRKQSVEADCRTNNIIRQSISYFDLEYDGDLCIILFTKDYQCLLCCIIIFVLPMHIHEFELRYRSYVGLNDKLKLAHDTESLLNRVHRHDCGPLEKKLTDIQPSELKILTQQTYTDYKHTLTQNYQNSSYGDFSISDYIHRLEYELKVIHEMWYDSYLLVVQDYINRAKQHMIGVWPWRWSVAWSLVSRCIWITDVDPLPYGLLFERFLNPARVSMPDIDVDFEDTLRDKVVDYIKDRYGKDHIASIGTFMKMGAKASFKDVARVMWIGFDRANQLSNLINTSTLSESVTQSEELKNIQESDQVVADTLQYAQWLEWTIRQIGVHACGMIIAPDVVTQYSAVQYPPIAGKNDVDRSKLVTQYDGHFVEDVGLLKMDFLGLRNLSIVKNTIKILDAKAKTNNTVLPEFVTNYLQTMSFNPPLDDTYTYEEVFQTGNTSGVFQFESEWMKSYLAKLKPNDINDIVAMCALYRPGPMEYIPKYIARKHGQEHIQYMTDELSTILEQHYGKAVVWSEQIKLDEDLAPFLELTYGIPVYQEQLMFLVQAMAWFSLAEADLLRRWIGKKIKEIIEKIKGDFVRKCAEYRWYKTQTSIYIYENMIEPAASYSFNKSHAVAYGLISYQTAYLKAHYPLEFHAALLRSLEDDTEKMAKFINEIKLKGISIKNPDVNVSYNHIASIDDHIRLWLLCIKGVWYEVWEFIQTQRQQQGLYKDLEDFLTRCQSIINKKSLESLIKSGALDCFVDRAILLANMTEILEWSKKSHDVGGGLFADLWPTLVLKEVPYMTHRDKLLAENEVFKTFISGHPFDGLYDYIRSKHHFISMFKQDEKFWDTSFVWYISWYTRARKKWFFIKIEDISGSIEIFTKDMMDLTKFDVLIIEWYKGKSLKIKKITKTHIQTLITEAQKAWTYKPDQSISLVLQKRWSHNQDTGNTIQDMSQTTNHPQVVIPTHNDHPQTDHIQDQDNPNQPYNFPLPKNIEHIAQIAHIIKSQPWTHPITIWSKLYHVSQQWYDHIQEIIQKT
jgi:DNA polymerase III alpha subunit